MKKSFKFNRSGDFDVLVGICRHIVFVPIGKVGGEDTLLKTGNYIYSPAPDGGNSPDWKSGRGYILGKRRVVRRSPGLRRLDG